MVGDVQGVARVSSGKYDKTRSAVKTVMDDKQPMVFIPAYYNIYLYIFIFFFFPPRVLSSRTNSIRIGCCFSHFSNRVSLARASGYYNILYYNVFGTKRYGTPAICHIERRRALISRSFRRRAEFKRDISIFFFFFFPRNNRSRRSSTRIVRVSSVYIYT